MSLWFRKFDFFSTPTKMEKKLNYKFKNSSLLDQALSHKSYTNSSNKIENNERLEYLGDAVLNLALGDLLMSTHQEADEGQLSKMRSSLVSTKGLYKKARELGFSQELKLSRAEKMNRGASNPRLLASAFEAIVGAVYLDGGYNVVQKIISAMFQKDLKNWVDEDYKTILQGRSQKVLQKVPHYQLVGEQGPAHRKIFFVQVILNGKVYGQGRGPTKKEAEQEAARKTLDFEDLFEEPGE
ncbi:MAG: ribonuclease III [Bdellovibrionales bacterium]|nr:ribonuclease III [Bdellovibrionales bacterium]